MAKILIVEDDLKEQLIIKNTLEQVGHEVNFTQDTLDFEEVVKRHQPDLILMDINLRHRSGIVLIHDLKRSEALAHIPIIVATALPINHIRPQLVKLGCTAFVEKPLYPPKLIEIVQNVFQSHEFSYRAFNQL